MYFFHPVNTQAIGEFFPVRQNGQVLQDVISYDGLCDDLSRTISDSVTYNISLRVSIAITVLR